MLARTNETHSTDGRLDDATVRVSDDGAVQTVAPGSIDRLKLHAGRFAVLPTPRELVVLKRATTSDAEPARRCLLFGEIGAFGSLHDVIQFLGHARWRGELVVKSDDTQRSLFLDDGHVLAAESQAPEEALDEMLERAAVITREQRLAAAEAMLDGFGEAATFLGLVDDERLFREMGRRMDAIFASALQAGSGTFTFLEGFDDSQLSFRRKQTIESLLLETLRGMDEGDHLRSRPASDHVVARFATGAPPPADPLGLYAALEQPRSVGALFASPSASELAMTRGLYELVQSGHVTISPPPTDVKRVVDAYNRAIGFLLVELDAMGAGDGVREKLAKFAADEQYKEFFEGAGPADDGSLDGSVIAAKVSAARDCAKAERHVASQLYDYASYSLFLARPHLLRRDREHPSSGTAVFDRVEAMLSPIAPSGERTMLPPTHGTMRPGVRPLPRNARSPSSTARLPRARIAEPPDVAPKRTARLPAFAGVGIEERRAPPSPLLAHGAATATATNDGPALAIAEAKRLAAICAAVAVVTTAIAAISLALLVR